MVDASVAKFSSAPSLRGYLLGTRWRVLVEASPDRVWGIGLAADSEFAQTRTAGAGSTCFALLEARGRLAG